jgi:hypothetical protein
MQEMSAEYREDLARLIARVRERAYVPERATDFAASHGILSITRPPATLGQIAQVEGALGVIFSSLLVALYTQVGNGGFGPAYGLVPLEEMVETGEWYHEPGVSRRLMKVCDWGCAIVSCLDFARPNLPVVRVYMEIEDEAPSLYSWLDDWLNDQPCFEERFTAFSH